jgi:SAM-dependent methyltransferase
VRGADVARQTASSQAPAAAGGGSAGADTVTRMKDYYEELWERLPADLAVPDLALRRSFLLEQVRPGDRALDLGCGAGAFTALLAGAGATAIGVEVAEAAVRRARDEHPGIDFRLAELNGELPLEDSSFEIVWASEVIEHVADTARWLSEVRRVLVPGGRLLVTTPDHPRLALALRGIERYSDPLGDHLHLYTRRSLGRLLDEFGFGEITIRAGGGIPGWRTTLLARGAR